MSKHQAKWTAENPGYAAKYREEHREEKAEYRHRYYEAHREEAAESSRRFRKAHPGELRTLNRNRRARKRNATGIHTPADILAQYVRQRGKCFWGRKINLECAVSLKANYHVDHVTPLVKKGSNGTENIVLTCPSCNLRKQAKHPMDFAGVML